MRVDLANDVIEAMGLNVVADVIISNKTNVHHSNRKGCPTKTRSHHKELLNWSKLLIENHVAAALLHHNCVMDRSFLVIFALPASALISFGA